MNVYLRVDDGLEFVGRASLTDDRCDEYAVDIDLAGTGQALRLVYELKTVPCMTPEGRAGMERAVLLSIGQTPDFLPGWESAD